MAVPIAKRLGLGSVLGYLVAGVAIGPVFGIVYAGETRELQHFAEFGVVMMLFLVGLELEPRALWGMRAKLLGLGGLQVAGTAALIAGAAPAVRPALAVRAGDRAGAVPVVHRHRAADPEREGADEGRGRAGRASRCC